MQNITTHEGRVSFPQVFKSKRNELSGKDEFSITLLFPKGSEAVAHLKKAFVEEATKKWGADLERVSKEKIFKNPLKDGDLVLDPKTGKTRKGYEGMVAVTFKNEAKPMVVDAAHQEIVNPNDFLGGCYAQVSATCNAFDVTANKGISFYLNAVKKTKDGESFGMARPSIDEAFGAPVSAGSENPANYAKKEELFKF